MRILKAELDNVRIAAQRVKDGGLIIYPTDTVYGLGCDPFNIEAVKRAFQAKGERKKPLPVLASDMRHVEEIASLSEGARRVASQFWPGQLTIVIPKKSVLPNIVTCNQNSVGVRIPRHDIALQLIRLSGGLLTGTSANKTGEKPPKTAYEAAEQLGRDVDIILDGGPATLGISSTVVDLTTEKPKILRRGPVKLKDVMVVLSPR